MNIFDISIITFINQFAGRSFMFDKIVKVIAHNNLFKGGIFAAILWWGWFRDDARDSDKREHIISTLFGSIAAIGLARLLALTLPFRLRPIHDAALNFVLPYGESTVTLENWSAFPSDHAIFFFTLATGLIFISKKIGIFALCYTALVICFPRLYLGLHWPTDILVGMVLGVAIAILCNVYLAKSKYLHTIGNLSYSQPMIFYPLLFLLTYQIADLFESSRALISAAFKAFQIDL